MEADGSTTKINESGPRLRESEVATLLATAEDTGGPGDWLAICGSLPSGFGADQLRASVVRARRSGRPIAVDTSEAALLELLSGRSDELPDLVKPNTHELATATQRTLATLGDVVAAAQVLRERGVATVLVSLGGDGAVLLDRAGVWHGTAPVDRVVNTVGAGDSFLAGFLAAQHPAAARASGIGPAGPGLGADVGGHRGAARRYGLPRPAAPRPAARGADRGPRPEPATVRTRRVTGSTSAQPNPPAKEKS